MSTEFEDLDLGGMNGAADSEGRKTLAPGNYVLTISEANKVTLNNGKAHYIELKFTSPDTGQYVKDKMMWKHANAKWSGEGGSRKHANNFAQGVDIGMKTLKTILIHANHPTPNKPGDPQSMIGLSVGVRVQQGESWQGDDGTMHPGGGEPFKKGAYFSPTSTNVVIGENLAGRAAGSDHVSSRRPDPDDDIPF